MAKAISAALKPASLHVQNEGGHLFINDAVKLICPKRLTEKELSEISHL